MQRPYFIGIAGGSCSGKTTLAKGLAARLGPDQSVTISLDAYYHGLQNATPETIARYNFDDPHALDRELLVTHLRMLSRGQAVDIPVYDFKTHTRTPRTSRVDPLPYIILEGLFPLYWDDVRSFLNTKVFVDVEHERCLSRRIDRDTTDRGRPREEVIRRYREMAQPMFARYIEPSRDFADVTVDGADTVDDIVRVVLDHIERANR
ncbi:MAG: uridine kinase [Candidatus Latescibacterota bacterium]|nr:MAG: uridine kinase [Candidatus Latescibacterota bacterium]